MPAAVYNYLGFYLNEVKYVNEQKDNTYIKINTNDYYNEKTNDYHLFVKVSADFANEESYFVFQGLFKIEDVNWYNSIPDSYRKSIFFSIVFPFVREKILTITSDSNQGLFIPTNDLKGFDFNKEFKLIKKTNNKEQ